MGARRTTRWTALFVAVALILTAIGLITDAGAALLGGGGGGTSSTTSKTITSSGPLTKIAIGADLNCAVNHTGDSKGAFFTDTACGTFVASGGTLYGPANVPGGPQDPGTSNYKKFTSLSQTNVTGTGTAANPYKVVTEVNVGGTGLRVTQTDTYVTGQSSYRTDVALKNTGPQNVDGVIYRAGNCQLASDNNGFGAADAGNGAISCVNAVTSGGQKVPGTRVEQWYPLSAGNRYSYDTPANIWSQLLSRQPLASACTGCSTYQDNGAAISWSFTLAPNATTTKSNLLSFQPLNTTPLTTTKTADAAAVAPSAATGYTIRVANSNSIGVTLTSIVDDLPAGFTYRSGTTTGVTTANPVVTNNGSRLTWNGPFAVPANGSVTLRFGVTAATTPGDYFNRASATATAPASVSPSGDTAKVTVVGPASLSITADRGATPANPASIAASDIPLQRTSPKVQSSPILGVPLLSSGIPGIPLLTSPILGVPLLSSPIYGVPLLSSPVLGIPLLSSGIPGIPLLTSPILGVPLLSSPFGLDSLANANDLGSSPLVRAGLDRISLASMEIVSGDPWPVRLAGTPLADRPLAEITLADLFAAGIPEEKMPSMSQLNLAGSPLGSLSSIALWLGDTRLKAIGGTAFNWCGKLESLGFANCGADLGVQGSPDRGQSASLLSLQVAGVDLDAIDGLKAVQLKDVTFPAEGEAVLPVLLLSSFDLFTSSIGGLLVKSVPNPDTVFDCTKIDCSASSTKNIYEAGLAGAIRPDAEIGMLGAAAGDLTIQEAVLGTYGSDPFNPLSLPSDQLRILGLGTAEVKYAIAFTNQAVLRNGEVKVTLPAQFRYVPGSAVVKLNGAPMAGAAAPVADEELVTFDLGTDPLPAGSTVTIDLTSRPGLTTGLLNASAVVTGDDFSLNAATNSPVNVTENFETGDTEGSAASVQPGNMNFAHMGHAGDVDYYSIPAPTPGSQINVYLTCGTCDADLTLYHPASAREHNPMRPAVDDPELRPELDHRASLSSTGEPLVPLALQDMPLLNRPVAGISANRGTEPESVQAPAWDAPGANYLVQVSSYNGSTSPVPYHLWISVTPAIGAPPVGNARAFPHDADATIDAPPVPESFAGTKTLVLANRNRLRRAYGDARAQVALDAIDRLAATPDLGVKVLFLDAFSEIPWAALDAQPSDPERSNDVVRAINARVDALLGPDRAGLQHIVLVGTDEIVPMGRIEDFSAVANERDFAQDLRGLAAATGGNNALLGAAANAKITTDDPFCSFSPRAFLGSHMYIPDVACGRLVESPEDIALVIDQFLTPTQEGDAPGVLRPAKSLSAGADWMKNLAQSMQATMDSELTPGQVTTLLNGWKRSTLQSAFPDAVPVPDIVGLQAHFNPNVLLPEDASEGLFTTNAFGDSTPAEIAKRIVTTMGCHSGFSITNFLSASGAAPDWAETMLGRGVAAFVGNTSYGIGIDGPDLAFSSRLFDEYVGRIAEMPLGIALAETKRQYLGGAVPNVYDYKIMAQANFFGLPMFRVAGAGDGPQPAPAPRPTTVDPATGLVAADITVTNPAGSGWTLKGNGHGSYWSLAGAGFHVERDRPIQPRVVLDVNQPNLEARGVTVTALSSVDQGSFDPALARTLVGGEATGEVQYGDTVFPTAIPSLADDKLSLTVGQFHSGPAGTESGVQRRFTNVGARVVYVPVGTPHVVPVIRAVSAEKHGATGTFKAIVDALGGSVRKVSVLYNDGTKPAWTHRDLAQAADGSWVGGFPISSTTIQYIVQAVSNTGDHAWSTNKGDNFDFVSPDANLPSINAEVTPNEVNGWYPEGATVILTGEGVDTFTVSDNNGPAMTWSAGQPIPVTGTGVHTLHYVASPGGQTGHVTVRVDTGVPTITGAPTTAPNGAGWYKGPVTVHFECADAESGVGSCEPDRTLSSDGTDQSVSGTAKDNVGNTATTTVGGINIDQTGPTLSAAPTTAPNASGWHNGPVTIRFTCSDERSGVATCPADQVVSTDGANQSVTGTATDVAGNTTSFTFSGINIDTTAPSITGATTTQPHGAGWHGGSSVTVRFTCSDALSGVTCPADVVVTEEGITNVTRTATDNAGNTASATVTVRLDQTGPTSTFDGSDTIIVLPGGPVTGTASDAHSGPGSVVVTFSPRLLGSPTTRTQNLSSCTTPTCSWSVSAPTMPGFYTATAVATDKAGNPQNPGTQRTVQVIS